MRPIRPGLRPSPAAKAAHASAADDVSAHSRSAHRPRRAIRRSRAIRCAAIPLVAVLLLGSPVASDRTPAPAEDECGSVHSPPFCTFRNAPARLGPAGVRLEGKPHPYYRLLAPLSFVDASGTVWSAPPSALTDGASIPPVFVPLVGNPRSPEFLAAAALHDAYCGAGNEGLDQFHARDWEATHRMFYDSLRSAGVSATKAKIMFAAVYLGGPRWDDPARSLEAVSKERLRAEMERCIAFIEDKDPSVAEIERWMRNREAALLSSEDTGP